MSPPTLAPLVTLSSDFGLQDAYVAQMKGVLLSEGPPDLRLVDLSHDLRRGDVTGAALFVEAAVPRFPAGTVHLVVVDPGVGSDRRLLIAEIPHPTQVGAQFVVAPDNGLLQPLLSHYPDVRLTALDIDTLAVGAVSATFHGRDLLAPVAARLARGMDPGALGVPMAEPKALDLPQAGAESGVTRGQILLVDRFGNLTTNIMDKHLPVDRSGRTLQARIAGHCIGPLRSHYAQVATGELLLLWDSGGHLEIARRDGSASSLLQVDRNAEVSVEVVDVVEDGPQRSGR